MFRKQFCNAVITRKITCLHSELFLRECECLFYIPMYFLCWFIAILSLLMFCCCNHVVYIPKHKCGPNCDMTLGPNKKNDANQQMFDAAKPVLM